MDAWFVGYTPDVTGAVWIGYDRTDEEHFLKGGSDYPTKMFKNILSGLKFEEKTSFTIPKKAKDLEKPIRLSRIPSLSATYQFHALQLFKVTLKWPAQDDDRVVYRIYERSGESKKLVGSVKGKGEYEIPYINIFQSIFIKLSLIIRKPIRKGKVLILSARAGNNKMLERSFVDFMTFPLYSYTIGHGKRYSLKRVLERNRF